MHFLCFLLLRSPLNVRYCFCFGAVSIHYVNNNSLFLGLVSFVGSSPGPHSFRFKDIHRIHCSTVSAFEIKFYALLYECYRKVDIMRKFNSAKLIRTCKHTEIPSMLFIHSVKVCNVHRHTWQQQYCVWNNELRFSLVGKWSIWPGFGAHGNKQRQMEYWAVTCNLY